LFSDPRQREILGLLLLAGGVVTLLGLLGVTSGTLADGWTRLLRRVFGLGALPAALLLAGVGLLLLFSNLRSPNVSWRAVVGLEVVFVAALGLAHLLAPGEDPLVVAEQGQGGGYIGWAISTLLVEALGPVVAFALLVVALAGGTALALDVSWPEVGQWIRERGREIRGRGQRISRGVRDKGETGEKRTGRKRKRDTGQPAPTPKVRSHREERRREKAAIPEKAKRKRGLLPPLDLLEPDPESEGDVSASIRHRAQVIQNTLASFGLPVSVVEINQGPVVTQFGVEPGYVEVRGPNGTVEQRKVKVSQISALAKDLSLALAAAPIRIEAPVPGRSMVGIEVPNSHISLVGLRGVMESAAFRRLKGPLKVALGRGVAGQPVVADLAAMPHLLIAGATGSGKSVCINSIVTCLLCNRTPQELRLVLIDPKMVELSRYNGVPHLLGQVETDVERIVGVLRWVTSEMDDRYERFAQIGARHIEDYNRRRGRGEPRLPYMVVVIDELADLMFIAGDEVERTICRIAQMARATGIHLVIATQRPSVDVVTGLIKANFPARISFAVTSQVDSRVILDMAGAETLLGRGDMLYLAADAAKPVRLQGCFVSDREIARVVRFWQEREREREGREGYERREEAPWESMLRQESRDDLLEKAIDLVQKHGSASASFLQRRLHIGYPRAARLMDQLEEMGIVGPAEPGGRPRRVLVEGERTPQQVAADRPPFSPEQGDDQG